MTAGLVGTGYALSGPGPFTIDGVQNELPRIGRDAPRGSTETNLTTPILATMMQEAGPKRTRYVEYDFFDANWGMLSLSKERVWQESVEGIYLSDAAIKLKAENPSLSYDEIKKQSAELLKRFPVLPAIRVRQAVDLFHKIN